jgi:hypothetical protein
MMLGDGSAQQIASDNLYQNWVKNALAEQAASGKATNLPGMRLIFP